MTTIQNLHDFTNCMSTSFALTIMSTLIVGHYHQKEGSKSKRTARKIGCIMCEVENTENLLHDDALGAGQLWFFKWLKPFNRRGFSCSKTQCVLRNYKHDDYSFRERICKDHILLLVHLSNKVQVYRERKQMWHPGPQATMPRNRLYFSYRIFS